MSPIDQTIAASAVSASAVLILWTTFANFPFANNPSCLGIFVPLAIITFAALYNIGAR